MEVILGKKNEMFAVSVIIKDNEFGLLIRLNKEVEEHGDYIAKPEDVVIWFDNLPAMRAFSDSLSILILGRQGFKLATMPDHSEPQNLN